MPLSIIIPVSCLFLVLGFFIARVSLLKTGSRVIQKAKIEKISIRQIGRIWSPELWINYSFIFNNKIYPGEGFLRIDRLLPHYQLLLFDRNGYPVLRTEQGEFVGEEHIETFVLQQNSEVQIEFNVKTLPESEIYRFQPENKTLFQNFDIKFPWT